MKKLIICLSLIASCSSIFSQDWKWGSNENKAREQWNLLEQKLVESDYKGAHKACSWLLSNSPQLNVDLYIKASKVYEHLVDQETNDKHDETLIKPLKDTALLIYDKRAQFFGNEAYVLDRKGMVAYDYLYKNKTQTDNLYSLYQKIVDLNGANTTAVNLTYLMRISALKYKANTLTKDDIFKLYLKIEDLLDQEFSLYSKEGKSTDLLSLNKESIEKTFNKSVELNCEDIKVAFASKFNSTPNVESAKKIFSSMYTSTCTSDPLFIKATEYLITNQPEGKYYQVLSKVYFNNKEYNKSYDMYEKSLQFAQDSSSKSDIYLSMAQINYTQNNFTASRANALKSLELGHNQTNCYNLIGALYESSYNSCKSENTIKAKAVFIAAYDMYAKAGNTERMTATHNSFPTIEEIFMNNLKEGDSIHIDCWINKSISLRKK